MKIKKALKVSGFVFLGIILLAGILYAFLYFQYHGKYSTNSEKYAHNVGYIDPSNVIQPHEGFELCGDGRLIGYYHSAAPKIYKGKKHRFRKHILSGFENKGYTDTGMLNLRFHVNCNGQVGNIEVNELNSNYEKSSFSPELVDQLVELVAQSENWETFAGKDYNYYMYLNFIIKDGAITEVIP